MKNRTTFLGAYTRAERHEVTRQAMYYDVIQGIEARSCYACYIGKAGSITYSVCLSAACNAQAPYYMVTCDLSGSATFFHITSKTARFRKKIIERKARVLIFSTTTV